jgi:hypothetical protein
VAAQEVAQSVPRTFPDRRRLRGGGLWDIERARVYFIAGGGLIKIGVTVDVDERLQRLRLSCPVELRHFGSFPGTQNTERELHKKFAHIRHHGEWFQDTQELRDEIIRLCGDIWLLGRDATWQATMISGSPYNDTVIR